MADLNDMNTAARMNEAVTKIVVGVLETLMPRDRNGVVQSVTVATRKVNVLYPDENVAVPLTGPTLLPVVGSTVRVSGPSGGRYIDEVLSGGVQFADNLTVNGALKATANISGATLTVPGLSTLGSISVTNTGVGATFGTSDQYASAIKILPSSHATSERAAIDFGDWQVGNDLLANGTNAFYWFAYTGAVTRMSLTQGGLLKIGNGNESLRFVGNSSFLAFYDAAETTRYGYFQGVSNGLYIGVDNGNPMFIRANAQYFQNAAGTLNYLSIDSSGYVTIHNTGGTLKQDSFRVLTSSTSSFFNVNYESSSWNIEAYDGANTAKRGLTLNKYGGYVGIGTGQISSYGLSIALSTVLNGGTLIGFGTTFECFPQGTFRGTGGGGTWSEAALFLNNSAAGVGAHTSMTFHPGSTAPMLKTLYGNAAIYCYGADGTTPYTLAAAAFSVISTLRSKQNVAEWPPRTLSAAAPSALDRIKELRPISFQRHDSALIETPTGRRMDAYIRLTNYQRRMGRPEYVLPLHDCATDGCAGDADNPCSRVVEFRRGELGFAAEEVAPVLPEAVSIGTDMKPQSIDIASMLTAAIAALQEVAARVEAIEAQLAGAD